MHISSLFLRSYSPNDLIEGEIEVTHEGVKVTVELSESDRHAIQDIVTKRFLAEREKMARHILDNSPAYVALNAPCPGHIGKDDDPTTCRYCGERSFEQGIEDAHFEEISVINDNGLTF